MKAERPGVLVVSSLTALRTLDLGWCKVMDEMRRPVSSLTSLTTLNLRGCGNITSEGLRAVIK